MKPGPKPTPTALKQLRGNPGKRALPKNEPQPPVIEQGSALMTPPRWLDAIARGEWRRVMVQLVPLGLVTAVDLAALEGYCKAYSRWQKAEKALDREGLEMKAGKTGYRQQQPKVAIALRYLQQMHSLAAEFGFTPASRSRVNAPPAGEGKDPYEDYLKKRPQAAAPARAATAAPEGRA